MCPTGSVVRMEKDAGIPTLRSAFEVLDADRDGKISRDDLAAFYGGMAGPSSPEDDVIGSMMTVADANRDGFVEYDEFEKVLGDGGARRSGGGDGLMEGVFRAMDRDGDGIVGHDDLKSYLTGAGFEVTDDDVSAMIKLGGGGGGNGGVTYDGLLKVLAI